VKAFKDNADRTWEIAITVASIKRVKAYVEVDLLDAVEGHLLQKLSLDPVLLCDVIYAVCKPDADKLEITDEQFGQAMAGDAIDRATAALLEELVDFFPQSRRKVLRTAVEKFHLLETMAYDKAMERLESPELEQQMKEALDAFGSSSTNSPASPESKPAP